MLDFMVRADGAKLLSTFAGHLQLGQYELARGMMVNVYESCSPLGLLKLLSDLVRWGCDRADNDGPDAYQGPCWYWWRSVPVGKTPSVPSLYHLRLLAYTDYQYFARRYVRERAAKGEPCSGLPCPLEGDAADPRSADCPRLVKYLSFGALIGDLQHGAPAHVEKLEMVLSCYRTAYAAGLRGSTFAPYDDVGGVVLEPAHMADLLWYLFGVLNRQFMHAVLRDYCEAATHGPAVLALFQKRLAKQVLTLCEGGRSPDVLDAALELLPYLAHAPDATPEDDACLEEVFAALVTQYPSSRHVSRMSAALLGSTLPTALPILQRVVDSRMEAESVQKLLSRDELDSQTLMQISAAGYGSPFFVTLTNALKVLDKYLTSGEEASDKHLLHELTPLLSPRAMRPLRWLLLVVLSGNVSGVPWGAKRVSVGACFKRLAELPGEPPKDPCFRFLCDTALFEGSMMHTLAGMLIHATGTPHGRAVLNELKDDPLAKLLASADPTADASGGGFGGDGHAGRVAALLAKTKDTSLVATLAPYLALLDLEAVASIVSSRPSLQRPHVRYHERELSLFHALIALHAVLRAVLVPHSAFHVASCVELQLSKVPWAGIRLMAVCHCLSLLYIRRSKVAPAAFDLRLVATGKRGYICDAPLARDVVGALRRVASAVAHDHDSDAALHERAQLVLTWLDAALKRIDFGEWYCDSNRTQDVSAITTESTGHLKLHGCPLEASLRAPTAFLATALKHGDYETARFIASYFFRPVRRGGAGTNVTAVPAADGADRPAGEHDGRAAAAAFVPPTPLRVLLTELRRGAHGADGASLVDDVDHCVPPAAGAGVVNILGDAVPTPPAPGVPARPGAAVTSRPPALPAGSTPKLSDELLFYLPSGVVDHRRRGFEGVAAVAAGPDHSGARAGTSERVALHALTLFMHHLQRRDWEDVTVHPDAVRAAGGPASPVALVLHYLRGGSAAIHPTRALLSQHPNEHIRRMVFDGHQFEQVAAYAKLINVNPHRAALCILCAIRDQVSATSVESHTAAQRNGNTATLRGVDASRTTDISVPVLDWLAAADPSAVDPLIAAAVGTLLRTGRGVDAAVDTKAAGLAHGVGSPSYDRWVAAATNAVADVVGRMGVSSARGAPLHAADGRAQQPISLSAARQGAAAVPPRHACKLPYLNDGDRFVLGGEDVGVPSGVEPVPASAAAAAARLSALIHGGNGAGGGAMNDAPQVTWRSAEAAEAHAVLLTGAVCDGGVDSAYSLLAAAAGTAGGDSEAKLPWDHGLTRVALEDQTEGGAEDDALVAAVRGVLAEALRRINGNRRDDALQLSRCASRLLQRVRDPARVATEILLDAQYTPVLPHEVLRDVLEGLPVATSTAAYPPHAAGSDADETPDAWRAEPPPPLPPPSVPTATAGFASDGAEEVGVTGTGTTTTTRASTAATTMHYAYSGSTEPQAAGAGGATGTATTATGEGRGGERGSALPPAVDARVAALRRAVALQERLLAIPAAAEVLRDTPHQRLDALDHFTGTLLVTRTSDVDPLLAVDVFHLLFPPSSPADVRDEDLLRALHGKHIAGLLKDSQYLEVSEYLESIAEAGGHDEAKELCLAFASAPQHSLEDKEVLAGLGGAQPEVMLGLRLLESLEGSREQHSIMALVKRPELLAEQLLRDGKVHNVHLALMEYPDVVKSHVIEFYAMKSMDLGEPGSDDATAAAVPPDTHRSFVSSSAIPSPVPSFSSGVGSSHGGPTPSARPPREPPALGASDRLVPSSPRFTRTSRLAFRYAEAPSLALCRSLVSIIPDNQRAADVCMTILHELSKALKNPAHCQPRQLLGSVSPSPARARSRGPASVPLLPRTSVGGASASANAQAAPPKRNRRWILAAMEELGREAQKRLVEVSPQKLAVCDEYLGKIKLLKMIEISVGKRFEKTPPYHDGGPMSLADGGMFATLGLEDLDDPSAARRVIDTLVSWDRTRLALDVAAKCGISPDTVWVAWGLSALKIGWWAAARHHFAKASKPAVAAVLSDIQDVLEGPALQQHSLGHLGVYATQGGEIAPPAISGRPPSSASGDAAAKELGVERAREAVHYTEQYGTDEDLVAYYMRQDDYARVVDLTVSRRLTNTFVHEVFLPMREGGNTAVLRSAMLRHDGSLASSRTLLFAICRYLKRLAADASAASAGGTTSRAPPADKDLHAALLVELGEWQEWMCDYVRYALTCIDLFLLADDPCKQRVYLEKAEKQLNLAAADRQPHMPQSFMNTTTGSLLGSHSYSHTPHAQQPQAQQATPAQASRSLKEVTDGDTTLSSIPLEEDQTLSGSCEDLASLAHTLTLDPSKHSIPTPLGATEVFDNWNTVHRSHVNDEGIAVPPSTMDPAAIQECLEKVELQLSVLQVYAAQDTACASAIVIPSIDGARATLFGPAPAQQAVAEGILPFNFTLACQILRRYELDKPTAFHNAAVHTATAKQEKRLETLLKYINSALSSKEFDTVVLACVHELCAHAAPDLKTAERLIPMISSPSEEAAKAWLACKKWKKAYFIAAELTAAPGGVALIRLVVESVKRSGIHSNEAKKVLAACEETLQRHGAS